MHFINIIFTLAVFTFISVSAVPLVSGRQGDTKMSDDADAERIEAEKKIDRILGSSGINTVS